MVTPCYIRYKNADIVLDHHWSSFYIKEIGKDYINLESVLKRDDGKPEIAMTLNFDMTDKDDRTLRNEIEWVYQWHLNHCKECKSGKEQPCIGYELSLKATLKELVEYKPKKSNLKSKK
jgi:hypothetical protein